MADKHTRRSGDFRVYWVRKTQDEISLHVLKKGLDSTEDAIIWIETNGDSATDYQILQYESSKKVKVTQKAIDADEVTVERKETTDG